MRRAAPAEAVSWREDIVCTPQRSLGANASQFRGLPRNERWGVGVIVWTESKPIRETPKCFSTSGFGGT